MHNKFHDALEPIHASEELKQTLHTFIQSEVGKRQRKTRVRYALACCAMLFVLVCGIGGYSFYQTPVSYISVDVNPSVELELNLFDRVISTSAYNEDGAQILENLNLKNKPYREAVELLLSDKTFESYLSEDSSLSFTVVSKKQGELLAGIQQCQGYSENRATCHSANRDNMQPAHHSGLSVGKYEAYLELSKYDKTITPEDCQNLSMREIRDRISQYTGEPTENSTVGMGSGGGHHGPGHHGGRWE